MARKEGGDPLEGVKGKEHPLGRTSIPPLTRLPHEIGDWRSEMKIGERATLLYERAAMELTSSLWHDRVRREPVSSKDRGGARGTPERHAPLPTWRA